MDPQPGPEPREVRELGGEAAGRLARMFTSPVAVFAELAITPTWLWAILLMIAMSLGVQAVLTPRIDFPATLRQAMAERASSAREMTDEQIERIASTQRKVAKAMVYGTPLLVPVIYLLLGGVYFLGLKVAGSDAEYKPVFAAVTHATFPSSLLSSALLAVVVAQRESFAAQEIPRLLKGNLAAWLDPQTSKPLLAVAGAIDVFNVWQWVLLALGLAIVGKVSRGKAVAVVAVPWLVWIAGKAAFAAIF